MPLKSGARGKSRLTLRPEDRRRLVRAMALDTVEAVTASRRVAQVVLVVEDADDGQPFARLDGVRIHLTRTRSLNDALRDGVRSAADSADCVASLPCDLPSLRTHELDSALDAAGRHPLAAVADRHGSGTTLLAAASAADLQPAYGPDSMRRHLALGAVSIELPPTSGLRRDVDLDGDLAEVSGPRSRALLDRLRGCAVGGERRR